VLSRAFFGDVPEVKRTISHTLRSWRSGPALADVTWRRPSPFRSTSMPINELEQLSGSKASSRLQVLFRRDLGVPSVILLVTCIGIELILLAAIGVAFVIALPPTVELEPIEYLRLAADPGVHEPLAEVLLVVCYAGVMSVVELFYVAAGFALYINRRVSLEGWDIEIVFRRLAQRLERGASKTTGTLVALLAAGLLAFFGGPGEAVASDDADPDLREDAEIQRTIDRILEEDEFGEETTETYWKRKEEFDDLTDREPNDPEDATTLRNIGLTMASGFELVLWLLAGGIVVAAIVYFARRSTDELAGRSGEAGWQAPEPTASSVAGSAREPTLPPALLDEAIARWEAGEHTESLAYLFRGTVTSLAEVYDIRLDDNLTAHECAYEVERAGGPGGFMNRLAHAWTATVYAERPPNDDDARRLFDEWRHHFGRGDGR
ncbi:MAG: DUF4129 domain-containing protein, partial [Persicimonas sp.]